MATLKNTGATLSGVGVNVDAGNPDWTNPNNIATDNDSTYASCTLPADPYSGYTDILRGHTYGFSIPSDAVIKGIEVTVRAKVVATAAQIYEVSLRNGSTLLGSVKTVGQALTTSFANYTFGSSSDVWGSSSSALMAVINTSDFGIYLAGAKSVSADKTIYVQYIKVTVYYVIPPTADIQSTSSIQSASAQANGVLTDDGGQACDTRFRHAEVLQRDDFEWGSDGDPLSDDGGGIDWTTTATGTSKVEIDTDAALEPFPSGTRAARLYRDGTNSANAQFGATLAEVGAIRFKVHRATGSGRLAALGGAVVGEDTKRIYFRILETGALAYFDSTGTAVTLMTLAADTWYGIEACNIDWSGETYDIYVNGELVESVTGIQNIAGYENICVFSNYYGTGSFYFDDIEVLADWTVSSWDETGYSTTDTYNKELTGLDTLTDYVVETQAQNDAGEGAWSDSDYFRTVASATVSTGLTIGASIGRKTTYARDTSSSLTAAASIIKSWGRTVATSSALAVSTTITKFRGWTVTTTSNLQVGVSIVIDAIEEFLATVSVGLTVAASVARVWGRTVTTSSALTVATSIGKAWGRKITSSVGLTIGTAISKLRNRTITTSSGLTVASTIGRTVGWARDTASALVVGVSIVTDQIAHYTVTIATNLSVGVSIAREWAIERATTSALTLATSISRVKNRTIATSVGLTVATTISKTVAWTRATASSLGVLVTIVTDILNQYVETVTVGLTVAVDVSRSFGKLIATSSALAVGTTISRTLAWARSTTAGVTIATTISRAMAYAREAASKLAASVSISKATGYVITVAASLNVMVSLMILPRIKSMIFRVIKTFTGRTIKDADAFRDIK